MRRLCLWIVALATLTASVDAQNPELAPRYRPERDVAGVIRSWGNNEMAALLKSWEQGFRKYHSAIRFENRLMGPASAMAGVYTGVADLSWMGHEILKEESMAFEWVFQYKAFGVEVANAGLDVHNHGSALVVFVHKDNPITKLTLAELDAIFGSEHRRGAKNIRQWSELGLAGEWADKPIHAYGYDAETEGGSFFRHTVLKDSYKWNCDLKEFNDAQRADGSIVDAGPKILEALAQDPYGIAYSKLRYANPAVKAVALAATGVGPYFAPTRENVRQWNYPLTRVMMVYLNRATGKPADPKLAEFLRYILSQEGQQAVAREGGYLPLTGEAVREQLRRLE